MKIIPSDKAEHQFDMQAHVGDPTGAGAKREQVPGKWRRFYDQLLQQRDRLIDAAEDLEENAREIQPDPAKNSPAEIGTEEFQRDQLLASRTFEQGTLEEINAALSRIENGNYGTCEVTGKPIPEARLEAIPWTRFSVEGQEQLEARGEADRVALGARGEGGPMAGLGSGHQGAG